MVGGFGFTTTKGKQRLEGAREANVCRRLLEIEWAGRGGGIPRERSGNELRAPKLVAKRGRKAGEKN